MSDFKVGDVVVEKNGTIWNIKNVPRDGFCFVDTKNDGDTVHISQIRHATPKEKDDFYRIEKQKEPKVGHIYNRNPQEEGYDFNRLTVTKVESRVVKVINSDGKTSSFEKKYFINRYGTGESMQEETTEHRADPPFKVGDRVLVEGVITKIQDNGSIRVEYDTSSYENDWNYYEPAKIHSLAPKEPAAVVADSEAGKVVRFSEKEERGDIIALSYAIGFLTHDIRLNHSCHTKQALERLTELRQKLMGAENAA